jgi:hypothetical protein
MPAYGAWESRLVSYDFRLLEPKFRRKTWMLTEAGA